MSHKLIAQAQARAKTTEPLWKTPEEYLAWRDAEAEKDSQRVFLENKERITGNILGRSCIKARHLNCSFENYKATLPEQIRAVETIKKLTGSYLNHTERGFVLSGGVGTGKNHLIAAMGLTLIDKGFSVVVITVSELMAKIRSSYNKDSKLSEEDIITHFAGLDLLVLDEVGRSHLASENQKVILDRLIDQRYQNRKPTGLITNLPYQGVVDAIGDASLDRIMEDGEWVTFNWFSYRRKKA